MKYRSYIVVMFLTVFCLLTAAAVVLAGDAEAIKTRMLERLPVINDYKTQGIVGENNKGFLQVMGIDGEWTQVVAAENNDRKMVYQAIAAKTGAPVEAVGVRRALQIRESAAPGTWIQTDDGKWVKK
jgi:hypothetical protein